MKHCSKSQDITTEKLQRQITNNNKKSQNMTTKRYKITKEKKTNLINKKANTTTNHFVVRFSVWNL